MSLFAACSISLLIGIILGGGLIHYMWRRHVANRITENITEKKLLEKEIARLTARLKTAETEAKTWHYRATAALRIGK